MTGVLACDMYLVSVPYLFRYQTDQAYEHLILPKKYFLVFFVYQYVLNR